MGETKINGPFHSLRYRLLLGRDRRKILQILFDNGGSLNDISLKASVYGSSNLQSRLAGQFISALTYLEHSGYVVIDEDTASLSDPGALLRFDINEGRIKSSNIRSWVALAVSIAATLFTILK